MTDDAPPTTATLDYLGPALVLLRLFRGLSQAELAERAGIRSNQISRYETGQVLPQIAQLDRLAQALDVDVTAIFVFTDQVAALARTVAVTQGDTERLIAQVQHLVYDIEGFQRFVGSRLHRILTESLDRQRFEELAREELPREVEVTTEGRGDAQERDAPEVGDHDEGGCPEFPTPEAAPSLTAEPVRRAREED